MADLTVTLGLDQTEMEKGLAEAGKSIDNNFSKVKNPFEKAAGILSTPSGIGGLLGGPVGMMIGQFVEAFGQAIGKVIDYVKDLIAYATKLRNLSIATGVSTKELQQLEGIAEASGVGLDTVAHSFNEFNKRMAEARIKGSEVNNILAKMGVGMDQVANGQFRSIDAMKALAAAYEAGTDAQTLAYYGNKLFGSSFEQLLPIIKRGSAAIDEYKRATFENSNASIDSLARLSEGWDIFWRGIKVGFMEIIGRIAEFYQTIFDYTRILELKAIAMFSPKTAGIMTERLLPATLSPEQRKAQVELITMGMSDENKKAFMDAYQEASGGKGKKLSPFGLSEAGAASQMQQMGGGDIFGAVAFSPLDAIKDNTKEIAENTRPKPEAAAPVTQTPLLK